MLRSIAKEKLVDVQAQLSIMTSNLISRMILNKRYVAMTDENTVDQAEAHAFQEMIEETFLLSGALNLGDFIPFLRWLDLQGYGKRLKKIHTRLDKFVSKIISEHRTRRQNTPVAEVDKDMVDVLLDELETKTFGYQMTEANVKSIILVKLCNCVNRHRFIHNILKPCELIVFLFRLSEQISKNQGSSSLGMNTEHAQLARSD